MAQKTVYATITWCDGTIQTYHTANSFKVGFADTLGTRPCKVVFTKGKTTRSDFEVVF